MFLASDEGSAGSVIANAERISPFNRGFNHFSFCSGVPTRSNTSMLPVSGALQFKVSDASGLLPNSLAINA